MLRVDGSHLDVITVVSTRPRKDSTIKYFLCTYQEWRTLYEQHTCFSSPESCTGDGEATVASWRTVFGGTDLLYITRRSRKESASLMDGTIDAAIECESAGTELDQSQALYAIGLLFQYCRFFVTRQGYIGIACAEVEFGDTICIFRGASMPFCVREVEGRGKGVSSLVSPCYIDGMSSKSPMVPILADADHSQALWRAKQFELTLERCLATVAGSRMYLSP